MKKNEEIMKIEESISSIEKSISDSEAKIESLKCRKVELLQHYHRILLSVDFYDNYFYYPRQKSLADEFNIKGYFKNNLPHVNMSEGDYKKISFKATDKRLTLLHYCTCEWGNDKYKHLIDIPLELFDSEDTTALADYLSAWFEHSKQTHDRIKKEAKQKQIEKLIAELNSLK